MIAAATPFGEGKFLRERKVARRCLSVGSNGYFNDLISQHLSSGKIEPAYSKASERAAILFHLPFASKCLCRWAESATAACWRSLR